MTRIAILAGASGLIGRCLLPKLLNSQDYSSVVTVGRRPLAVEHLKLRKVVADFDDLSGVIPQMRADDAFCCLGTTQAKAGGRAGLERVDLGMVVEFARAARLAGAARLFVVSAIGSSAKSLSFYSRTKARMEAAVAEIDYRTIQIVQPSLLLGERGESRPLETLGQRLAPLLSPLLAGPLASYRPVTADAVAEALLSLAGDPQPQGIRRHTLPL